MIWRISYPNSTPSPKKCPPPKIKNEIKKTKVNG